MKQALELALEALEGMQNAIYNIGGEHVIDLNYAVEKADVAEQAITAIKEALAQPEQDQDEVDIRSRLYQRIHELETQLAQPEQAPVASIFISGIGEREFDDWGIGLPMGRNILYTTPPQRKPLTDEEILTVARDHYNPHQRPEISFARAIEAAHGIKE